MEKGWKRKGVTRAGVERESGVGLVALFFVVFRAAWSGVIAFVHKQSKQQSTQ